MNKVAPWKAESKQREKGEERETGRSQKYETRKERKRRGGAESSQEAPLKFVHNVEISVKELPLNAAPSFF